MRALALALLCAATPASASDLIVLQGIFCDPAGDTGASVQRTLAAASETRPVGGCRFARVEMRPLAIVGRVARSPQGPLDVYRAEIVTEYREIMGTGHWYVLGKEGELPIKYVAVAAGSLPNEK